MGGPEVYVLLSYLLLLSYLCTCTHITPQLHTAAGRGVNTEDAREITCKYTCRDTY